MKLWLLRSISGGGWGEYDGFLIRAADEAAARAIAKEHEKSGDWLNPRETTCEEVTADGEAEIVISDFNAG